MMDFFFPMRHFLSECLQHHILPLWCPYVFLGNPFYADPQSGLWYLVDVMIAATVGYNIYTVQAEFIFHLLLAAFGFYKLMCTLRLPEKSAAVVAALFPLTGFFVAHASHPAFIVSLAWMPLTFHLFIRGMEEKRISKFLLSGLTLSLCLTGGYVAFAVLSGYALLAIYIYFQYKHRKDTGYFLQTTLYSFLALIVTVALSSAYLFSLLEALPSLKRAEGLSVAVVNVNSFSPQSLLTLLLPFAGDAHHAFFETDVTMRNIYMGFLLFPLLLIGVLWGNRKRNLALFAIGLFCLSIALGKYLPVREWLYYTVPFMKLFRHPAIFRVFTISSFLLIAADGLGILFQSDSLKQKKILILTLLGELLVIIAVAAVALRHTGMSFSFPDFVSVQSVSDFNHQGSLSSHILVQAIIQGIMIALSLAVFSIVKRKKLALFVAAFWLLDMLIATQMNVPGTVISTVPASEFNKKCNQLPKGFPVPGNAAIETYNQYGGKALEPLVYNASMLRKEPCSDGFNPFYLKQFANFSNSPLANKTLKHSMAFVSDDLKPLSQLEEDLKSGTVDSNSLYTDQAIPATVAGNVISKVSVQTFEPGNVVVETETDKPAFLTLLQSNYPGWSAAIDGLAAPIMTTNYTFMTIALPRGKHQVSFVFSPPHFYSVAGLQLFSYVAMGFALILLRRRERVN